MENKPAKSVPNTKKSPGISPAKYRQYWKAKVDPRSGRRFTNAPSLLDWLQIQTLKQTELDSLTSLHRCSLCLEGCGSSDGRRFFTAESRLKHIRLHLSLESPGESDESKLEELADKSFPNVPQSRPGGSNDTKDSNNAPALGKPKQRRSGKRKSPTVCACPNCKANGGKALKGLDKRKLHLCHFDGCGKTFGQTAHLRVHLRTHTGEKPFSRDIDSCGMRFIYSSNLNVHRRTHSGEQPFRCDFDGCGKEFSQMGNLMTHRRIHSGEKPFICEFDGCGKRFNDSGSLKKHRRIHTGERPFSCDFDGCGRRFTESSALTMHRRIHSGEKPFFCEFDGCGMRFSQSSSLGVHRRIHSGEKPFTCHFTSCGKKFGRTHHLRDHLRTHTGEKPFTCDFDGCGKSFSQSAYLNTHRRTHTGEKPYICDACEKGFTQRGHMNQHVQTHTTATAKPGTVKQTRPSDKPAKAVSHGLPSKPPPLKKARLSKEIPWKDRTAVACADCALPFPNWTLAEYHRQYAHRPALTPGKLACEQCPGRKVGAGWKLNEYDTQADLDRHHKECMVKHPVPCERCPRRFASKGNLCSHRLATHDYTVPDH